MFWLLVASRILGALLAPIPDCDEVFNYWEPTHFLVHGSGQQTWEYSPDYALRSYWYILLHAFPAYLLSLILTDKITQFRVLRVLLGVVSAKCQHFCWSKVKKMYDSEEKKTAKTVLVLNLGLFLASHTYLPSTFSMNMLLLALGWFLDYGKTKKNTSLWLCLLACGYGVAVGWPFCAVLILLFLLPFIHKIALDVISPKVLFPAFLALAAALIPSWAADSHYYGKSVFGVWNLLIYNTSFGRGNLAGSSVLYGVEPWYFYIANLSLNFNIVFLAFLCYPGFLLYQILTKTGRNKWTKMGLVSGCFGWLFLMSLQPHKVTDRSGRAVHVPDLPLHLYPGGGNHYKNQIRQSIFVQIRAFGRVGISAFHVCPGCQELRRPCHDLELSDGGPGLFGQGMVQIPILLFPQKRYFSVLRRWSKEPVTTGIQ